MTFEAQQSIELLNDPQSGVIPALAALLIRNIELLDVKLEYEHACNQDLARQLNTALHPKQCGP